VKTRKREKTTTRGGKGKRPKATEISWDGNIFTVPSIATRGRGKKSKKKKRSERGIGKSQTT